MKAKNLVSVLCATHLSSLVEQPFEGLGGMLIVAPPEAMKTAMLKCLEPYPDVLTETDLNTQKLVKMRDRILNGMVRTVALTDFQKIYERDPATAANVEGNLRALVSEGFSSASFENSGINRQVARCVVIGACTVELQDRYWRRWETSGFARRFLWPMYSLSNGQVIMDAIARWEKIELGYGIIPPPANRTIKYTVTPKEAAVLRGLVQNQYGQTETFALMCRIYAVLKWNERRMERKGWAIDTICDFGESLGKNGAKMVL